MAHRPETHAVPPALATPTDLGANATRAIAAALNGLLADVFALYLKTKNFHWHMSGTHFRDYHVLLDEQADQILAMTDVLAERVRKVGHLTLHSIGEISRNQRIPRQRRPVCPAPGHAGRTARGQRRAGARMREAHEMIDEQRTWRARACWRRSSTRPSGAPGSCTRQATFRQARHSRRCPARACVRGVIARARQRPWRIRGAGLDCFRATLLAMSVRAWRSSFFAGREPAGLPALAPTRALAPPIGRNPPIRFGPRTDFG